ncbi:UDP-glucose iridoid glucosyltransferase-like [Olea europaea subsp. europaea]|uniref:UDP-glucose iridoid glucosyltransferase-like n=1 Tax=Olea europaea subsp. europaea TaxID=158383 RepID=A0A8S0VCD5_OLEEU|nr:UDP-glucose iridoid glucosyltransferase-like [Olea europaea subsp. europaea]
MGTIEGQQPRVVLVPFPYQGHITPMLQLGSILNSRGFSITVAHTEFNSPDPLDHPEFVFLPLPDNLSGCETSYISSLKGISAMNVNSKERFHEYMVEMLEKQPQNGLVSCIVIIGTASATGSITGVVVVVTATAQQCTWFERCDASSDGNKSPALVISIAFAMNLILE